MTELTLFDQLLEAARIERERVARGKNHVNREELAAELTPLGTLRWYLHPALEEPSTRALYFFELEIPKGSRSGLMEHQGGVIHFVLEGSGWTEYDGVEHQWEAGDVIALPVKEAGIQFRHHNTGLNAARMLVTWPNFDSANGPEAGVVMRITENCPEWDAAEAAKAN